LSGTGELVNVKKVGNNKSKQTKLTIYTPSDPIKTTHQLDESSISKFFSEQRKQPLPSEQILKPGVTAVLAVMTAGWSGRRSSKKVSVKKTIRVLLDSGSDGDLLFHKKGAAKQFPYLARQVPKTWHTSNGDIHTKWKGRYQTEVLSVQQQQKGACAARCC
jgi:hypothetical protein